MVGQGPRLSRRAHFWLSYPPHIVRYLASIPRELHARRVHGGGNDWIGTRHLLANAFHPEGELRPLHRDARAFVRRLHRMHEL